ncbi:MAG: hypothetical protein ACKOEH_00560 [Actinomycetota bacterium]|jgi:uncharacterized membrane protein|nr:hypothetical protein [Actinomycetota bacterium]
MIVASSFLAVIFATISIVSGASLIFLVFSQERKTSSTEGMAAFHRHLNALSDESREHLRSQLREAKQRQTRN